MDRTGVWGFPESYGWPGNVERLCYNVDDHHGKKNINEDAQKQETKICLI